MRNIEDVAKFYEGNSAFDAQTYRALPASATDEEKIAALKEDVRWYRQHSEHVEQRTRTLISALENDQGDTRPPTT